jgi:hypothetical protein
MIFVMSLETELRSLVSELRKHNASYDSILLHALMHNRKSAAPWSEDDVRRFLRSYEAPVAPAKRPPPAMTAHNIVVRSETVGGTELKDFDAEVRDRAAAAAERQKIFHEATAPQRLVRNRRWSPKDIDKSAEKAK